MSRRRAPELAVFLNPLSLTLLFPGYFRRIMDHSSRVSYERIVRL